MNIFLIILQSLGLLFFYIIGIVLGIYLIIKIIKTFIKILKFLLF